MHATFTGVSGRPRNINLSGRPGNPFSNTSWSPSSVSDPNKAVARAQANREKREAERQRLNAAHNIQRVWRGHRTRLSVSKSHRQLYDSLYGPDPTVPSPQRFSTAFRLLLSFFTSRRQDDIERLLRFVTECETNDVTVLEIPGLTLHTTTRFVQILVEATNSIVREEKAIPTTLRMMNLVVSIIDAFPGALSNSVDLYYTILAYLCRTQEGGSGFASQIIQAFSKPFKSVLDPGLDAKIYQAVVLKFLTQEPLIVFEHNVQAFSEFVNFDKLNIVILNSFSKKPQEISTDERLWLMAHFIGVCYICPSVSSGVAYLKVLYTQLRSLSLDIGIRLGTNNKSDNGQQDTGAEGIADESLARTLDPYIKEQLLSLVKYEAISKLLQTFSQNLSNSLEGQIHDTSLLAGYISTLLLCFPAEADEIRLRLLMEPMVSSEGETSTVRLLWQALKQTPLLQNLVAESQPPVEILRNYVQSPNDPSQNTTERQELNLALMFLELYIFVLRLSDDEDFFSAISPPLMGSSNSSTCLIRRCSLSLSDLKLLTRFLKNTAFALHYKSRQIAQTLHDAEASAASRLGAYLGTVTSSTSGLTASHSEATPSPNMNSDSNIDLAGTRDIVTTAMKMLYERDSRKQFFAPGHWLMTDKLNNEDFITAVMAEEERQRQESGVRNGEDDDEHEDEEDSAVHQYNSQSSTTRTLHNARLELIRARQRRSQGERRMAEMGPKLEILKHMPFIVPFETRVKIFRKFIMMDRLIREQGAGSSGRRPMIDMDMELGGFMTSARHHATIRRGELFEDAFQAFSRLGEGFKDPISITFEDQFGALEAGIDGGGVTKEFLTSVITEAFGHKERTLGLFTSSSSGLLFPNPMAVDNVRRVRPDDVYTGPEWARDVTSLLQRYEFLGRIVGKCMYEGILVDLNFAGFFLLQWSTPNSNEGNAYKGSVNDLRDMDEDLYKGMLQLKNYSGDISGLGLDFSITDGASLPHEPPATITRNLIPDGDKALVTNDNRLLYISYIARHRLVIQPRLQTAAFLRGLRSMIKPSWLSMFNPPELQRLVGGDSSEIDINDLRRNTVYSGVYVIGDDGQEHPTIQRFWNVLTGFDDAQRRDVLKYCTSTPRAPLLGFSQLNPKFSIRDAGRDQDRLPSASTCVNLLKLPQYQTEEVLRNKLLYAITAGAGFDLS